MSDPLLLGGSLEFSYNQFMVFDSEEDEPGCEWTEDHIKQGFAKRERTVNFGTILDYGFAQLAVIDGSPQSVDDSDRAVSVCIYCPSGELHIEGPEEDTGLRRLKIAVGFYRIVCLQKVLEDELIIHLYIQPQSESTPSEILKADEELQLAGSIVESAEVAGV